MELRAWTTTVTTREPFVIARGTEEIIELAQVELRHDGVSGFGEAAPIERYDESAASALAFLEGAADLLGDDPFALEEIGSRLAEHEGEQAAKAALDAALHDLCGKLTGLPVWRMLGLRRAGPPTSWTIWLGDPDDMARRAEHVAGKFKRLKLKLGAGDGLDIERVRAVRRVTDAPLQVDVNEGWEEDEAIENLPRLAELGVEYCEQPLPAGDWEGFKGRSPIPIYLDENCHTLEDVEECARWADGINIKLAKSGGIREALRMIHAARALGLGIMLGCMVESGLGIAAACQVASLCDHVDLDGNLLLREDPWPGVRLVDGIQLPADSPGLGVHEAVPDPR